MEIDSNKNDSLPKDTASLFFDQHKSPIIEQYLDEMAVSISGHSRNSGKCATCDNEKVMTREDFRDELSWKEFGISRMCQKCQDIIWIE